MRFRLQKLRIALMVVIAALIVIQIVWLVMAPTAGGGIVVLALAGSLFALLFDYHRRRSERQKDKRTSNLKPGSYEEK